MWFIFINVYYGNWKKWDFWYLYSYFQGVISLKKKHIWAYSLFQKRGDDFETVSFWLSNTCRFLHCLKQYSGEEVRKSCLQNQHAKKRKEKTPACYTFSDLYKENM